MTQTASIHLTQPVDGGDTDTWGGKINIDLTLIDRAVNGTITVAVPDANVVLVADGTTSDQSIYAIYRFTGALTANRTITLPSNVKVGYAINATTGSHNVILSAGGTTFSVTPDSYYTFFVCDGTDVAAPTMRFGGIAVTGGMTLGGALTVTTGGIAITGNSTITGTLGVTGAVSLSGAVTAVGLGTFGTLASGAAVLSSTLSVAGATTCAGVNASGVIQTTSTAGAATINNGWTMTDTGTAAFGPSGYTYGIIANATNMLAGAYVAASDADLKSSVETISPGEGLIFVATARPVMYRKRARFDDLSDMGVPETGFIAQEEATAGRGRLVQVAPHDSMPARPHLNLPAGQMLALPPQHGVAHLVAAVQALLSRVEELEDRLEARR